MAVTEDGDSTAHRERGGGAKRLAAAALTVAATLLAGLVPAGAAASPAPDPNPWLEQRGVLNMAHQGGELEAPSSTLYAFRTAVADRGADTLEMDVHVTADDRLVVLHDDTVARTTPVGDAVDDLTLEEIQALDAAYWFSPGRGQFDHTLDPSAYPLRGVRTGERPPPPGYAPDDFRIPTLDEVLAAFPDVPLNIEVKTRDGVANEGYALRIAQRLGALLNRPEHRGRRIIVASTAQSALERVRELAPDVDVSASVASMLSFMLDGTPIEPRPVALQVPIRLGDLVLPTMLRERDANGLGYAVHAWTGSADENDETYRFLIESGLQGIMTMAPSVLHDYLCRAGERRPDGSPRCAAQRMGWRLRLPSRSLRKLRRGGLPLALRCSQACRARVEAAVPRAVARRHRIAVPKAGRGPVRVGAGRLVSGRPRAGANRFRVRLAPGPARKLAKVRRLRLRLTVSLADGTGWPVEVPARWIVLKAPRRG